jgi:hypothetical protein
MTAENSKPRVSAEITENDQLGPIVAVAKFMKVGRTWLFSAKKCALRRHSEENPSFMRGGKTSKQLVLRWLDKNQDFKPTDWYVPKPRPSQSRQQQPRGQTP